MGKQLAADGTLDLLAPTQGLPNCFTTGKYRYKTEQEAKAAMPDSRAYKCPFCRSIHITHKPKLSKRGRHREKGWVNYGPKPRKLSKKEEKAWEELRRRLRKRKSKKVKRGLKDRLRRSPA